MSDVSSTERFDKFPKWLWGTPSTKDTPAVPPPFSVTTAVVYVALKSHEGMKDGARPSINPRIMEMTGLGESTIWRSIRELESAGVLKVESRGRSQPNRYQFPTTRLVSHSDRSAKLTDQVSHRDRPGSPKLAAERNQYRETEERDQGWGWGGYAASASGENQTRPARSQEQGDGEERQAQGEGTPTHLGRERSEHDLGPSEAARTSGPMMSTSNKWGSDFREMVDQDHRAMALVDHFDKCRTAAGFRAGSEKARTGGWLNSARILLKDYPYDEIGGLISWVFQDDHWSREVSSVYALGTDPRTKRLRYADLLAESKRRQPKSASSGCQPPWRRGPWKNVSPEEKAAADRKAASGFARLEDL